MSNHPLKYRTHDDRWRCRDKDCTFELSSTMLDALGYKVEDALKGDRVIYFEEAFVADTDFEGRIGPDPSGARLHESSKADTESEPS